MEEWRLAHAESTKLPEPRVLQRWKPSDEGWKKANSDGAVSKFGDKGGGGLVLRDHNGAFVAGSSHFDPNNADPEAVEILAWRKAAQVAREMNIQKLHVELDNQKVVQMLNLLPKDLRATGPWIEEIKEILRGFEEVKVSWARRSANIAAHKFARVDVGHELCKVWLSIPSDFVLDVISDEIPNF
ncbi:uncharacterized protein [Aegilops tauschii subsp. strangulata]|uniref:uncharacterized protein n=1 Tax=Aegilops tauschii subsp. strangulata TaxID=200361 RepID=UPI003CC885AC